MKTLRFWVLPNEGFKTLSGIQDLLRDFHRDHPDLRIETKVRTVAQTWADLMLLAKRPNELEPPDLIQIPHGWTSGLADLDRLRELGGLEPRIPIEALAPQLQDHCRLAGTPHVYSAPWWFETRALVYRPAAFKRAGVEPALLGTWEGFREACAGLLASKTVLPLGNHHPRHSVSLEDAAPRIWARGGDILSRDGKRCIFQRDEGLKGIADCIEPWVQGWMPLPGGEGLTPGTVFDGSCAMQFSGRFPPEDSGLEAAAYPGDGPTVLTAQQLAISSHTSHPREAYELLRYLVDPKRSEAYAARLGVLPPWAEACERALGSRGPSGFVFAASLERARSLPNNPLLGTLDRVFSRVAESLLRHVLRGTYRPEALRQEVVHAAAEMDYVYQLSA